MNIASSQCLFPAEEGEPISLSGEKGTGDTAEKLIHVIDKASILAVRAAMATRRPLLVLGEPGVGKTQLAQAVAVKTQRQLITDVVNSKSEPEDLLWHFDAVGRIGAAHHHQDGNLHPARFLTPGPLWWAFDSVSADIQYGESRHKLYAKPEQQEWSRPENGSVVLIDEIDKADLDYPNALLDVFGQRSFSVPYIDEQAEVKSSLCNDRVTMQSGNEPFVIITSNGERSLPAAFVRRCWVLTMRLPRTKPEFREHLKTVALAHFNKGAVADTVMDDVLSKLWDDREHADKFQIPKPGQAEFIDTLKALIVLSEDKHQQKELWQDVNQFSFDKYKAMHLEPDADD